MYPRVKVREQEDPITIQEETTSLLLRVIESLSLEVHYSSSVSANNPEVERRNDSPSYARVATSHPKNSPTPSIPNTTGNNNKDIYEDGRNIRASSVPRPRAVLSSPDNDGLIGHQNRLSRQRQSLPKRQISSQNTRTEAQAKPSHRNSRVGSPLNRRKVSNKEAVNNTSHPKEKHASEPAVPRQGVSLRKEKPSTVRI